MLSHKQAVLEAQEKLRKRLSVTGDQPEDLTKALFLFLKTASPLTVAEMLGSHGTAVCLVMAKYYAQHREEGPCGR